MSKALDQAVEDIADVKCSPREYVEALEEIQSYIEICIDAAKEDVKREESEE
jgi:hypothetical protein